MIIVKTATKKGKSEQARVLELKVRRDFSIHSMDSRNLLLKSTWTREVRTRMSKFPQGQSQKSHNSDSQRPQLFRSHPDFLAQFIPRTAPQLFRSHPDILTQFTHRTAPSQN